MRVFKLILLSFLSFILFNFFAFILYAITYDDELPFFVNVTFGCMLEFFVITLTLAIFFDEYYEEKQIKKHYPYKRSNRISLE